jgi:rare lipoprotein A
MVISTALVPGNLKRRAGLQRSILQRSLALTSLRVVLLILVAMAMTACSALKSTPPAAPKGYPKPYRVYGHWYQPLPNARDFIQKGRASWYGKKFHGRRTSNGEIYDMYDLTAAHKTLPFGTFVRVENLDNGHRVDVRINDRGPFVRGRIIDLSYTAAKQIGMVGPGTARVRVVALGAPVPDQKAGQQPDYLPIDYYSGNFTFQVGAFAERTNAQRLVQKLDQIYHNAHMVPYHDGSRTFYRVRVGRSTSLEEAIRQEQELVQDGFPDTFIVAE